jgi:hypothetical protein
MRSLQGTRPRYVGDFKSPYCHRNGARRCSTSQPKFIDIGGKLYLGLGQFLPVSDALFNRFMSEQLRELEDSIRQAQQEDGGSRIVKERENARKRLATRLRQRADRERKDDAITFEELGIDQLSSPNDN